MVHYPTIYLPIKLESVSGNHEEDRINLRKSVIDLFVKEKAGHGKGDEASRYKYVVEKLPFGNTVYLTRPTRNFGFDFIVHIEGLTFPKNRPKDAPTHKDIGKALKKKKGENTEAYRFLLQAIEEIFLCNDAEETYEKYKEHLNTFKTGLSCEIILKVVKWFFIEQDVHYWNYSGRNMLMNGIRKI